MPIEGPVPAWLFSGVAGLTLWVVMFQVGLAIVPGEFRWVLARPGMLLKGLFSVLIAVPALALLVVRQVELARATEVGIVLMSISPGAPVALRRSIGAGGHRSFATVLQISVAVLAVVSMPLWIAVLDRVYDADASIAPQHLARQVFLAQLLPLAIGMLVRRFGMRVSDLLLPRLAPVAAGLLLLLTILALINVWKTVVEAGPGASLAIAATTLLALACGHLMGGPEPATRTATAVASAARNPGLALLVVSLNGGSPAIVVTVLAYLIICAFTVLPYVMWRRKAKRQKTEPT